MAKKVVSRYQPSLKEEPRDREKVDTAIEALDVDVEEPDLESGDRREGDEQ